MKSRMTWLAILCLALTTVPASAQLYSNGLCSLSSGGCSTDAWTINFGYVVSDTFTNNGGGISGFDFVVWAFPGDTLTSVDWSVTSAEFGGTTFGSGTGAASLVQDQGTNQYGYEILTYNVAANVYLAAGTYWLNLQNAVVPSGDPIYWDENGGPSQASESAVGTIPSESFDFTCGDRNQPNCLPPPTPEPSSILLFGSGALACMGMWLRKWL